MHSIKRQKSLLPPHSISQQNGMSKYLESGEIFPNSQQTPPTVLVNLWLHSLNANSLLNPRMPIEEHVADAYKRAMDTKASRKPENQTRFKKDEWQTIKELKADKTLVVNPSEKGNAFVVMSTVSYLEKGKNILESEDDYEQVKVTTAELNRNVREVIEATGEKLPERLEKAIEPFCTKMAHFHGLPKSHKSGLPLRPVVSTSDTPARDLSVLLERILRQLLQFVHAHFESTKEVIRILEKHRELPEDALLVSLDVVGLYSNIPIEDGEAVMAILESHIDEVVMLDLDIADIRNMVQYVLNNNVFEFNQQQFRQNTGIAMRNNLALPLAIVSTLSYLDILITVNKGRLEWELYINPIHSGVHLSYKSSHSMSCKRAVARNQFQRATNNASTSDGRKRGEEKIAELLRLNSYPEAEVRAAMNKQKACRKWAPERSSLARTFRSFRLLKTVCPEELVILFVNLS